MNEKVISLAFFDDEVTNEEKRNMVRSLNTVPGSVKPPWRRDPKDVKELTTLSDLVTMNSKRFFEILEIDDSFLQEDPEIWATHPAYVSGLEIVKSLVVTNDVAERGVKLVKDYKSMCKSMARFQNMLLVVDEHRKSTKY